ncbi:hypothetical protein TNIN_325431 [Trichonephila inaurata madagascariensis]|uniref:Uncharacterized protein n=1 Tax=Trichonephila inaurata madagascariensis TaxID=2747483 RepID=A0A8X6YYW9_9ARAC|nr:hypothetical protein TNIN_325431 [Trichonephila inaurata madagascariensis]
MSSSVAVFISDDDQLWRSLNAAVATDQHLLLRKQDKMKGAAREKKVGRKRYIGSTWVLLFPSVFQHHDSIDVIYIMSSRTFRLFVLSYAEKLSLSKWLQSSRNHIVF